ncbi:MAG: PQQ-like beta-propeller repeat protein [Pirellulales bacterium]|nr:PQQ-like beta-propeller repeat protein [Pirellulales bacterium]
MRNDFFENGRQVNGVKLRVATCLVLLAMLSSACGQDKDRGCTADSKAGAPSTTAPASVDPTDDLIASPEPGWPQWRGPRRDGISDEKGLLQKWPEDGPKLLWSKDDLGTGWCSPIVVGDQIFITGDVGDDLVIYCFDTAGKLIWKTKNGKSWTGSYPGSRACCVFSEGRIYQLGAHGRLACLRASDGKEIWAFNILERFDAKNIRWALGECLLVDGPRLIVSPGGKKAIVAALDKNSGKIVWTTPPLENAVEDEHAGHASPILFRYAGRRVLAHCTSAHGLGIDADSGKVLWTVPLENRFGTNVSTPIYGYGQVYYVTPYSELGRAYRLVADDGGINAEHMWTNPLDTVTGSGILIGKQFFSSGYSRIKYWCLVDWSSGQTLQKLKDLTTGAAIMADGRVYCQDEKGNVALLKHTPEGMEIVSRFRLPIGPKKVRDAWAHPVLCDGRLYLRYHDGFWCHDVKRR